MSATGVVDRREAKSKATFVTAKQARSAKARRERGDRAALECIGFEDYAAEWIRTYRGRTRRGVAQSTLADYRRSLEHYGVPFFEGMLLSEIEPRDVRGFVEYLESLGQAPSTVRKNFAPLRALLATAVEDGALRSNPAAVVRVVCVSGESDGSERRALSRDELAAFFAAVPKDWQPFFQLLGQTGVRISEAIGLTWSDIEWGPPAAISVRRQIYRGRVRAPKTRHGRRRIPLSPKMVSKLAELQRRTPFDAEGDTVFATAEGTPLDVSNLRSRVLRPASRQAGLGTIGFHTFRHTCASLLFEAGRNVKQIQEWLGHHDPGFTLSTYVHLIDQGLGDAEFLDAALGG